MNLFRLLAALALCAATSLASAAELRVLTAGAFKSVLLAVQPEFERATGHRLRIENDTAGALQRRILAGDAFDVVFSSPGSLQAMQAGGKLAPAAPVPLARVAIGVAVRRGTPRPDISSVAAFRTLLLQANKVAYIDPASGGSSGIYLDQLFDRLGVGSEVRAKAVLVPGGLVAPRVVNGEADVAIHQLSEIITVPEAQLVGLLPAEIQNYTVYAAAVARDSANASAVGDLIRLLQSASIDAVMADKGMERSR